MLLLRAQRQGPQGLIWAGNSPVRPWGKKGVHLNPRVSRTVLYLRPGVAQSLARGLAQQTEDPRAVVYISFPFSFFGVGLLSKQTRSDKLGETQPNKSKADCFGHRAGAAPLPDTAMESWCSQMTGASATLPSVSAHHPPCLLKFSEPFLGEAALAHFPLLRMPVLDIPDDSGR